MVTLYLFNQPETTWTKEGHYEGRADISLSSHGKRQTLRTAAYIHDKHVDAIIASPLARTSQAAKIFNTPKKFKIKKELRVIDIDLGLWTGKFQEELEGRFPDFWHTWKTTPSKASFPNGETMLQVQERVQGFLDSCRTNELFDKYYLVITHDIIIRSILALLENQSLDAIHTYTLDKASLTEVQIYPENRIIKINSMEHLG